jgi:hypothetical protein
MPVDVPRRPPLTGPERERNARNANGVQVAGGATGSARALRRTDTAQPWTHDVPAGGTTGQVLTKASDDDYDADWATPSGGGGIVAAATWEMDSPDFGPVSADTLDDSIGDYATYFAANPVGAPGPGIGCLVAGWYQVTCSGWVSNFTDGDVLRLFGPAAEGTVFRTIGGGGGGNAYPLWSDTDGSTFPFDYTSPPLYLDESVLTGPHPENAILRCSTELVGPNVGSTFAFLTQLYLTAFKLSG